MYGRVSESHAYKTFKKYAAHPRDRIDRVENVLVAGMFDVNWCPHDGPECWFEIKSPKEPKRDSTRLFGSNHPVSQDQANWALRQRNANGRAFLLIATDKRWMLIESKFIDAVNSMTVRELTEIASWVCMLPMSRADFLHLRTVMIG